MDLQLSWIFFAILAAWVILRFHARLFEVPRAGKMYDLATLILDPPAEEAEKPEETFAIMHTVEETELSIEDIRRVLYDSRDLAKGREKGTSSGELKTAQTASSVLLEKIGELAEVPAPVEVSLAKPISDTWNSSLTIDDITQMFTLLPAHPEVTRLLQIIDVYRDDFSAKGYYAIYQAIKDYLEEPETSSITRDNSGEVEVYRSSFDILSKITLIQHVCDVTRQMITELSGYAGMTRKLSEPCILAAVYHDLGKLKKFRDEYLEGTYRMTDHAQIAEDLLRSRLEDVSPKALNAILYHHKPKTSNPESSTISEMLKSADHEARARELRTQLRDVPGVADILCKDDAVQVLLEQIHLSAAEARTSTWPKAFVYSGYVIILKGTLTAAIQKFLDKSLRQVCREQYLDPSQFESAILGSFRQLRLITEDLCKSQLSFVYKSNSAKRRKVETLHGYLAIPIEALGHFSSSLPETASIARSVAKLEIERNTY